MLRSQVTQSDSKKSPPKKPELTQPLWTIFCCYTYLQCSQGFVGEFALWVDLDGFLDEFPGPVDVSPGLECQKAAVDENVGVGGVNLGSLELNTKFKGFES